MVLDSTCGIKGDSEKALPSCTAAWLKERGERRRLEKGITKGKSRRKRLYAGVIRWEPKTVVRLGGLTGLMRKHSGERAGFQSVVEHTAESEWRELGAAITPSKEHQAWRELP